VNNQAPINAPELEVAVIGAVLAGTIPLDDVTSVVSSEDMYDPKNHKIFNAMLALQEEDIAIDALTVGDRVGFDVFDYVNEGSVRPIEHANVLSQYAKRRYIASKTPEIRGKANNADYNFYTLVDDIARLSVEAESGQSQQVTTAWEALNSPDTDGEQLTMNVPKFDDGLFKHNGFRKGTYTAIFADSGHGKTTSMIMFAGYLMMSGEHVYWADLEGAKKNVLLPLYEFVAKKAPAEYVEEIMKRMHITDNRDGVSDIKDIKRIARQLNSGLKDGISAMFVDYIQNVDNAKYHNDSDKVKDSSQELNKLKSELDTAVIVGSQVTLKGKDRRSGWSLSPTDNDWRDSGQIKQDSDYILSVFRPSKIDELLEQDDSTGQVYAKDWNGRRIHKNSVFMHPVKVRGKMEFNKIHIIHNYYGLDFHED